MLLGGALIPAAILIDRRVGEDLRAQIRETLRREAVLLATDYEKNPPADVPAWVRDWEGRASARITVIDGDGRVLADSEVPESELPAVENHGNRPEVIAALAGHVGSEVHWSKTTSRELLYVAVPVSAPPARVMRVSLPLIEIATTLGRAQSAVWIAGLLALGLAFALAFAVSRWITGPVLAATRAARAMSRGDFEAPLPLPPDDELGELVRALSNLRHELARRLSELRGEGEKLRTILNGMTEGVALIQDGRVTVANPAFGALLGVGVVEGRRPIEAARLPDLHEAVESAMAEGKPAAREALVGGRTLHISALPLGEPGSEQAVVMLVDMTESRRLERLRRDLVANASHELRTPVAAIVGAAETLAGGAAEDPEARTSFVGILLRHAQRLSRLTNDLLDLSRLEAGYKPRVETFPAAAAVQTVLGALHERATAKNLQLESAVADELILSAERPAVEQILTNLVDNAIKYTQRGRVRVTAEARGERVLITVDDTGPGIPAVHLPRLFERFYRVDDARSRELGGTGLGLAIVKHLVLANGGEITVESEVGRGSRFVVSLPGA